MFGMASSVNVLNVLYVLFRLVFFFFFFFVTFFFCSCKYFFVLTRLLPLLHFVSLRLSKHWLHCLITPFFDFSFSRRSVFLVIPSGLSVPSKSVVR